MASSKTWSSPSHPPRLPLELLTHTFSFLASERHTLAISMRVSHSIHDIVGKLLYRRLDLRLDSSPHPLLDLDKPKMKSGTRGWKQAKKPELSRKKRLVRNVEMINVGHHFPFSFEAYGGSSFLSTLPRLQTLRINSLTGLGGSFHASSEEAKIPCSLISSMRPIQLVVRGALLFQRSSPLRAVPPVILLALRKYVCVIDVARTRPHHPEALNEALLDPTTAHLPVFTSIPADIQHVVVIFWTPFPIGHGQLNEDLGISRWGSSPSSRQGMRRKLRNWDVGGIFGAIAQLEFSIKGQVTVVGLGGICKNTIADVESESPERSVQETVESEVITCLETIMQAENWEEAKKNETRANMRFMTTRDYLKKGEWQDVLENKEVEAWLS